MIEQTIYDYLAGTLSVPVYMEEPEAPPEAFVLVEKTGSGRKNRICTAMIAVQSYGASLYDAATLNDQVKAALDALPTLDEICAARLNTDYNFTDTATKRYRYQAVYDISHY